MAVPRKKKPYRTVVSHLRLPAPVWEQIDALAGELGTLTRPSTVSVIVQEVSRLRRSGGFPKDSILSSEEEQE